MRIQGINVKTGETIIFPSLKATGEFLGIVSSGVIKRILNEKPSRDGWMFSRMPLTEAELKTLERQRERKRELNKQGFIQDTIKEIDRKKYRIMRYEKNRCNACITPCPHILSPKPMIGSGLCQRCPSFHGIDRNRQEVACGKTILTNNKKNK